MEAGDAPAATSAVAEDDANDDVDVFVVRVPAEEAVVVEYPVRDGVLTNVPTSISRPSPLLRRLSFACEHSGPPVARVLLHL